jgi:hypothetical protein
MFKMDDKNIELNRNHGSASNVLCVSGTIEDAMQLYDQNGNRYHPLDLHRQPTGEILLDHSSLLFKGYDSEYNIIHRFFSADEKSVIFNGGDERRDASLPYHHLLNLPNTPEDVRFRQEGVKELVENPRLYQALEGILASSYLYGYSTCRGYPYKDVRIRCDMTPEKLAEFVDDVVSLSDYQPESGPIRSIISWAENFDTDTVFQELVRNKRKLTDARIVAIYSERFNGIRYGLLRPGVNPEEVFDFLQPDIASDSIEKRDRRGKKRTETRDVVKYKGPLDESAIKGVVGHARQRMDVLNEVTAQMLAMPTFLMQLQMKHLYQGAYLHKALKKQGFPVTFPNISDEDGIVQIEGIYPIRMAFEQVAYSHRKKQKMAVNSFEFNPESRIVQIEGPNKRGKSEAWRTLHLLNALANSGYPVPASSVTMGVVPNSHFISCKGRSGHGGSELERSIRGIEEQLQEVYNGDMVILDEFGDSTNAPTALEIAKRLLPQLIDRGCRVYVTSHHDALTSYISNGLKGISLMPNPAEKGIRRYELIPSDKEVDFKAEKTLDDIGFTDKTVRKNLPNESRLSARRRDPERDDYLREDDDIPF